MLKNRAKEEKKSLPRYHRFPRCDEKEEKLDNSIDLKIEIKVENLKLGRGRWSSENLHDVVSVESRMLSSHKYARTEFSRHDEGKEKLENCNELDWKGVKSWKLDEMVVQKPSKRRNF